MSTRAKLIGARLLQAIPVVIGVVIITFLLTRALPGDPAVYFAGDAADEASIQQVREKLGLDKPLPQQFLRYVSDLVSGDWGNSLSTGQPVLSDIARRLPASLELTLIALLLSCAIAIPLGVMAATKPGSWRDHLCRVLVTLPDRQRTCRRLGNLWRRCQATGAACLHNGDLHPCTYRAHDPRGNATSALL